MPTPPDNATTAAPSAAETLHPRIAELIGALDAARDELRALLMQIPSHQRDARAADDEWTVTQIVEHLAAVEDGAGRLVSKIASEARNAAKHDPETTSILGANDAYDIVGNERRIKAPEMVQPKLGLAYEAALEKLETARARLKEALRNASGLDLAAGSHPHPLFGPFTGYQWALATAQHERRHIGQIRRQLGITRPA